ncbi:MAG: GTPase HflX [Bacteroidales bacterium]|jgi:GTP-binding protein HflX|nr:GTPase HflX [Bacteroidales bacterium]
MRRSWKTNKGKWKSETGVWEGENLVPAKRQTPQERNTFSTAVVAERAILVSVCDAHTTMERTEECLRELAFLLETAGGVPVKSVIQKLDHPDSRTYIGSGKLEEVLEYKHATDADFLVFDDELTPAQLRNLERAFGCRILDRTTLILDIFAKRARTAEAKTQVELAQLQYMLPRLTRMWTHLERQRGGIGMRGPGESQIETDRRLIGEKITLLKERLQNIDKQRTQQRKNRESLVRVALVGYTNVGKSTLMNLLSKSDVFAENKLFATLDTTVRKVVFGNLPFLLTDTVGFIRKLPHGLVESFKSTLDEVREADLLIHVVDISHRDYEQQIASVNRTLEELGAVDKPTLMVFNKIDAYRYVEKEADDLTPMTKENWTLEMLEHSWLSKENGARTVFISAGERVNIDRLREMMYDEIKGIHAVRYPYNNFLY